MAEAAAATGPDFAQGIPASAIPEQGPLAGRVGEDPVLLSRIDGRLHAVSGTCTHYGAPLAAGLADGRTIRCPWHHACFDLATGEALRAPAFAPLDRWEVEQAGALVFVRRKAEARAPARVDTPVDVRAVVIVGGGAAGFACAERLRALGFDGRLTMLSADDDPPVDRPNLSKDYLAGNAPPEWIPLRDDAWYRDQRIDLRLGAEVVAIDTAGRAVATRSGETFGYDRLLLATGSEPVRLAESAFDPERVRVLRSLADARALVAQARPGARIVILGSSFIGLEAAAAFRARELDVAIVSPDAVPFERTLGVEVGRFFQALHEMNGVAFHLGRTGVALDDGTLRLDDGHALDAEFLLAGIGVRPRTALAAEAGLNPERGVQVDAFLETNVPGIYAAGDIAAYPDPLSERRLRIEHWVVAERQGQAVAANMLGLRRRFDSVPFFWTEQYGTALRYVGHAAEPDEVRILGSIAEGAFIARYYENGQFRASAAVGMDQASLEDERELERMIADAGAGHSPVPSPIGRGIG